MLRINSIASLSLRRFCILILVLLTACADEPQVTIRPFSPPIATVSNILLIDNTLPPESPTASEATPLPTAVNNTLAPSATLPPNLPSPTPFVPTLPPMLDPKSEPLGGQPLLPNSFVAASADGLFAISLPAKITHLLNGEAGFANPKIAPNGSQIAVLRTDRLTRQTQMVLVDTKGLVKPLNVEGGGTVLAADFSPNSKTLVLSRVFDSNTDGLQDVYDDPSLLLYDIASGKQEPLGRGSHAVWSPDGSSIAYLMGAPSQETLDPATREPLRNANQLLLYNVFDKSKRELLNSKDLELEGNLKLRYFKAVAWQPNNTTLAVSADALGADNLRTGLVFSLAISDPKPKILAVAGDAAGDLVWSDDAQQLAFEILPQYPIGIKSAAQIALWQADTAIRLLGDPATRTESRHPRWLKSLQQLAFLEGDQAVLTIVEQNGFYLNRLFSNCTGFDWY